MNIKFNFSNPTNLHFGSEKLNELGDLLMPGNKAMVLISNGKSTKANGYLDRTLERLKIAGVECIIFDKIMENSVKEVNKYRYYDEEQLLIANTSRTVFKFT